MPAAEQVVCPSCKRKYAYRPELAGKKVKCKCGQMILVTAPEDEEDSYDIDEPAAPVDDIVAVAQAAESAVPDTGYRCPGCRQPMNPGTYVCDSCGFNLRTGVKPSSRPAGEAGALSAAKGFNIKTPGGGKAKLALKSGKSHKPGAKKSGSSFQMSPVMIIGIIAVIGAGAFYGMKFLGGEKADSSSTGAKSKPALGDDPQVASMMEDEGPTEVREWLKDDRHKLGTGWSQKQANARMDDIYNMGAVKITAFSSGVCLAFAIELPADKDKRGEIFRWVKKHHDEMSKETPNDVGQKYLLVATPT